MLDPSTPWATEGERDSNAYMHDAITMPRRRDRQILDPHDILALIETADSCRLGLVDMRGSVPLPYVVALNYGYEPASEDGLKGTFWFHGAREGRKIVVMCASPQACVQIDLEHQPVKNALGCGWGTRYASVFAQGTARLVDDDHQRRHGIDVLMAHYERLWGAPEGAEPGVALPIDENLLGRTQVFCMGVERLSAKRRA